MMAKPKEIFMDGSAYIWNGNRWYQASSFLTPPTSAIIKLEIFLLAALQEEDSKISDIDDLLDRARQAGEAHQQERAVAIAQRVLKVEPLNAGAAEILCSALRALSRPGQAIKETQAFKDTDHVPLLIARAAALCDLEKWAEASSEIKRARALGSDPCVALVAKRIKNKNGKPQAPKKS